MALKSSNDHDDADLEKTEVQLEFLGMRQKSISLIYQYKISVRQILLL